jgi:ketopantoate reductase
VFQFEYLLDLFPEKLVSLIDTCPRETTSSLTRDVWEGKPSEIEYQNGTVVKLGEKFRMDLTMISSRRSFKLIINLMCWQSGHSL